MGRRRAFTALLLVSIAGVLTLACNALTGVDGLIASDDEAGAPDGGVPTTLDARADPAVSCSCVAAPPAEWSGPLLVIEGSATAAAGACPSGLDATFEGGIDPSGPPGCSPCTCGAPSGTCGGATVQIYRQPSCSSTCGSPIEIGTTCTSVKYCDPSSAAIVTGTLDGGGCAPKGGDLQALVWARSAVACGFVGTAPASCAAGQACAPKSAAAPGARTCILHAGDVMCPGGAFSARTVYQGKVTDTRSCTKCRCAPPSGTCTGGTVSFYADTSCNNLLEAVPSSAACEGVSVPFGQGSGKLTAAPKDFDGGCAADGGAYQDGGAVTASDPTTLCCL